MYVINLRTKNKMYIDYFIPKNEFVTRPPTSSLHFTSELYFFLVASMQLLMTNAHKSSLDVHVHVQVKHINFPNALLNYLTNTSLPVQT